jgi:hypothetical protein
VARKGLASGRHAGGQGEILNEAPRIAPDGAGLQGVPNEGCHETENYHSRVVCIFFAGNALASSLRFSNTLQSNTICRFLEQF